MHTRTVSRWTALASLPLGLVLMTGAAQAHTALFSCYDNGDGTVLCEAGFSDGSSASGVPVRVLDAEGGVLVEDKMDANSEITFTRPDGAFSVLMDAGEGHQITIPADDIY
ncbi:hypothetical protein [Roseospira visakhapatnamensis]|uniref:Uncharacterized protein n=1 Tax=Roseospira visakhapatnamensis TaxID=390880 RepID=A0A7W6RDR7_9PROT|nr:hypothetical protein [Roseospira visakhapatnamensis]MBB4266457.1 hypothetical protein [Roseospira visakhapatnamensis]